MKFSNAFDLPGRGPAIEGVILSGTVSVGDKVRIFALLETIDAVCVGVMKGRKFIDKATKGENVALVFRYGLLDTRMLRNVSAVTSNADLELFSRFKVRCNFLPEGRVGLPEKFRSNLVRGRIHCMVEFTIETEGNDVDAIVETMCMIPVDVDEQFDIQVDGKTIGNCVVTKIL